MERAAVNGVELEYEVLGAGEPVLLISPVLADGFLPLLSEPALAERHQLVRYHRRGWSGSTRTTAPVTISDHAEDATALLEYLGIARAHLVGHGTGASIAAQVALDHPAAAHSLILLDLALLSVPSGEAFFQAAGESLEAYGSGDHAQAVALFMSTVSGLDWPTCRAQLEGRVPGVVDQAVKDADTLFGVELPSLGGWIFGADQAAAVQQPVLSLHGSETLPLWVEVDQFLRSSLPHVDSATVQGVGHLLHLQRPEPVARVMSGFLAEHPLTAP